MELSFTRKQKFLLGFFFGIVLGLSVYGYIEFSSGQAQLHEALGKYGVDVMNILGKDTTGMAATWFDGYQNVEIAFNKGSGMVFGIAIGLAIGGFTMFFVTYVLQKKDA